MAREIERLKAELEAHRRRAESLGSKLLEMEAPPLVTEQTQRNVCEKDASPRKHQHPDLLKHSTSTRSRLPVPIRPNHLLGSSRKAGSLANERESQSLRDESHLMENTQLQGHGLPRLLDLDGPGQMGVVPRSSLWPDSEQPSDLHAGSDAALRSQLELLHGECQDQEQVIARLEERAAESGELQAALLQKERLCRELGEALQAAESTIAYLTACNLDSQGREHQAHDSELQAQFGQLQQALQEKDDLNQQLLERLHVAESSLASLGAFTVDAAALTACTDPQELARQLQRALQPSSRPSAQPPANTETVEDLQVRDPDVHRQIDHLQEALWEQSRLNAELQERLRAAEQSTHRDGAPNPGSDHSGQGEQPRKAPEAQGKEQKDRHEMGGNKRQDTKGAKLRPQPGETHDDPRSPDQLIRWLVAYLQAAESCVASLSAFCVDGSTRDGPRGLAELRQQLETLQKAGREKNRLHEFYADESNQPGGKPAGRQDTAKDATTTATLHDNIGLIQEAHAESWRVISDLRQALEDQKQLAGNREGQLRAGLSAAGPAHAQGQLESLQKALKEKKRSCKALEEKLAAAHAIIARHTPAHKTHSASQQTTSLEQDDKGVQVDLQDLGYETSGKSENEVDREENSSTDNDLGLQLHPGESNISALLQQVRGVFSSSTENLESNSSASYPSSPTLSSPKAGPKGLQAYEDRGQTDGADRLRLQVSELKGQLENRRRLIHHLQGLLRRCSLSGDPLTVTSDPGHSGAGKHDSGLGDGQDHASGDLGAELTRGEEEMRAMEDRIAALTAELEKERSVSRSLTEQLQHIQLRSRSASPARMDSLVQSQARELSHLRQQIKESRGLGGLQRQQLQELHRAFEELLQASDVDYYMGEVFREQLDKSLTLLERLEDRLENGDAHSDNEDSAVLELAQRESLCLSLDSPSSVHQQVGLLRTQLRYLVQQNQDLAEATKEQLNLLSKELQDKNRLVQSLQKQLRGQSPSSLHSSDSEPSDRASTYTASPTSTHRLSYDRAFPGVKGMNDLAAVDPAGGAASGRSTNSGSGRESGAACQALGVGDAGTDPRHAGTDPRHAGTDPRHAGTDPRHAGTDPRHAGTDPRHAGTDPRHAGTDPRHAGTDPRHAGTDPRHAGTDPRLQDLQRENSRLLDQLRSSAQLNETLRSELDLHCSILTHRDEAGPDRPDSTAPREGHRGSAAGALSPDLLAEHLQEIRSLRRRLEETIRTNDRLRQQLERRLAEVEKDPAATNIFIHGTEDQGQLANELRFLWGQNQALKEQLSLGSRDKQKENEKLRESLARRTAKLEYVRTEFEALKKESGRLQSRVSATLEDNTRLQEALRCGRDQIHRLQSEINIQRQQLMDNHQLLQSLRVELQVYEQIEADSDQQTAPAPAQSTPSPGPGPVDLGELLSEIRHLRLQLERSIHTNNALRQRLEEQLLRGPKQEGSPSILINYLLSGEARAPAGDDGAKPPAGDCCDPPQGSARTRDPSAVLHEVKRPSCVGIWTACPSAASSGDSTSPAPSRLVPGHRMWANKNGRHILGLIEDYNALRKQISEGRKLTHGMDRHLQDCFHSLSQHDAQSQVLDQQLLKGFSTSINTMQQVLEEAGRLLKLVWRVSLPSSFTVEGTHSHQDELLMNEVSRLKSRLSQQEKMLMGAVNRLRSTNQLKEGMEKIIIDQLSLTHGVLKKARGNLEVPVNGQ
ncbi:hypothetical protein COCON_G00162370 [Conger conger]|uniref:CDK5 regulatory subunit-associated protein 2 n=1 Tax=Conger conger TaxID=82655 RepID=A0A9Q1D6Z4_CONCO|nr:hypothetical protein COCON_G00162370 [Conger conger]